MNRAIPGAVALLALLGSGAGVLEAQQWTFGSEIADLTWSQYGLVGGCNQNRGASPAIAVFGGRRLVPGLTLVATARVHYSWNPVALSCANLFKPSSAGTQVLEYGVNPLVHTFVAPDLRIEYAPRLPWFAPMLAVGGGAILWNGATTPYGLLAAGLGIRARPVKVSVIAEYQRLGLKLDRVQQTYVLDPMSGYPVLSAQTDLGYARIWKSARLLALRFDFSVRTPR